MLQSKYGILRSIYIRLREVYPQIDARIHVSNSIDISNHLYGSNMISAYEP